MDDYERIQGCIVLLGKFCKDTGAEKMTLECENATFQDESVGSWKVTIEKVENIENGM